MIKFKHFIHQWVWIILIIYCGVGMVYPLIGLAALICMLAPPVTAIFKGRMWCGNFCPRGSFNDVLLSKISMKKHIPGFIKTTWFRLLFFTLLMGVFIVQIASVWGSLEAVSFVFIRMVILTTAISIVLGTFYYPRTWCMICPMGTMAHYIGKLKLAKSKCRYVEFNKEQCVGCNLCSKNCPIGIDVLSYKEQGKVSHADCLKCNACVKQCPKKSLSIY